MEVLGRFQYHVIGGATGSGKGKLLDTLTAQGAQVPPLLSSLLQVYDLPLGPVTCSLGWWQQTCHHDMQVPCSATTC